MAKRGKEPRPKRPIEPVVEYIAREAARRYGPIEPDLPGKVRRNVKRGFGSDLSTEEVRTLLLHYKEIYAFAASILRNNREYWEQDFVRSGDAACSSGCSWRNTIENAGPFWTWLPNVPATTSCCHDARDWAKPASTSQFTVVTCVAVVGRATGAELPSDGDMGSAAWRLVPAASCFTAANGKDEKLAFIVRTTPA